MLKLTTRSETRLCCANSELCCVELGNEGGIYILNVLVSNTVLPLEKILQKYLRLWRATELCVPFDRSKATGTPCAF
jgi:hypothetical protein